MEKDKPTAKDLMMIPALLSSGYFGPGGGAYSSQDWREFKQYEQSEPDTKKPVNDEKADGGT